MRTTHAMWETNSVKASNAYAKFDMVKFSKNLLSFCKFYQSKQTNVKNQMLGSLFTTVVSFSSIKWNLQTSNLALTRDRGENPIHSLNCAIRRGSKRALRVIARLDNECLMAILMRLQLRSSKCNTNNEDVHIFYNYVIFSTKVFKNAAVTDYMFVGASVSSQMYWRKVQVRMYVSEMNWGENAFTRSLGTLTILACRSEPLKFNILKRCENIIRNHSFCLDTYRLELFLTCQKRQTIFIDRGPKLLIFR
ncbi:hypothetical protein EGR_00088 [Echinococcus granulosus]|uniref:Uncharacterized protein n=1 Tax=Echinococcus granulosus TaxID=6210 RepID=W6VD11_ECHGR|nr:hypothetical protein EGR_00088 [Echinococcus granulosus]EUB64819.1 hypothetical protein EGR_00088 [Echinococcus granulosus]